jgi:hypothetical protein
MSLYTTLLTVGELISQLESIKREHGDIPIAIKNRDGSIYTTLSKPQITDQAAAVTVAGETKVYAAVDADFPQPRRQKIAYLAS